MITLADLLISDSNTTASDPVCQQALAKCQGMGLPTRKWQCWKYDTLNEVFSRTVQPDTSQEQITNIQCATDYKLVFINGSYQASASHLPKGIDVTQQDSGELWYDFIKEMPSQEVLAWLGLHQQSVRTHISVAANVSISGLTIVHYLNTTATAMANISWSLAPNAQLESTTEFRGHTSNACYIYNQVATLANDSHWRSDVIQKLPAESEVFYHNYAKLAENAHYQQATLHFGAKRSRNYEQIDLLGAHANASFKGLALPSTRQKHQQLLCINHRNLHTSSTQHFKSAVGSDAMFNFLGRIYVQQHAQKTDASQLNHNMLMTKSATAYTKPELEIYADDVKCAHGTTIGQVDKSKLLFLQMRGLDTDKAKSLILSGFCAEMLAIFHSKTARNTTEEAIEQLVI